MFDLGLTELMLVGIVALIVVGPKDLPVMFRQAGRFMGKARGMAREFSRAMNDAADEAGVKDVASTMRAASDPASFGSDAIRDALRAPDAAPLTPERAEAKEKIAAATAQKAQERRAAEVNASAEELEAEPDEPPSPPEGGENERK